MIKRDLARMQIANDVIEVVERTIERADVVDFKELAPQIAAEMAPWIAHRKDFRDDPEQWIWKRYDGHVIQAEWWAACGDDILAHGFLLLTGQPETVALWAVVRESHRKQGLGKLMGRCAVDLAIYHRMRTILCGIRPANRAAVWILDGEDFEKVSQDNGFDVYRRDLKWLS